jgi:hypothetical protein
MGFGTLFATVAFFVIMATGAFLFTTNIMYTAEVVSTSLDASSDLQYARLKTDIDIVDEDDPDNPIKVDTITDIITVFIDNIGSMKILDTDFEYMDVYVRYTKSGQSEPEPITRIPFDEWTGKVVESCDSINPGIFDPDERLNITIQVPEVTSPATDNYIKIVTPNGVWATKTGFDAPP